MESYFLKKLCNSVFYAVILDSHFSLKLQNIVSFAKIVKLRFSANAFFFFDLEKKSMRPKNKNVVTSRWFYVSNILCTSILY